jgi:hypothetical protein
MRSMFLPLALPSIVVLAGFATFGYVLRSSAPEPETPGRFTEVLAERPAGSGFSRIRVFRDTADGRCHAVFVNGDGPASLGPVPCL